ncbi:MAG: hypothetical protein HYS37_13125 [Candidatus Rokubacteria bacterium]|nr:hypothetical protein [Candidatus Rokubacteria bacterium]
MRAALLALLLAGCALPVEGEFAGRPLAGRDPAATLVVIYNHGFSRERAGTYTPAVPPIIQRVTERNPDVVVFAQLRNEATLSSWDHSSYIESSVALFHRGLGVPLENIILVGQSCGAWGSLQAAAFMYPALGGVIALAPTCHGRLPHSVTATIQRRNEIVQIAQRLRTPGVIFLYEGDAYYDLADWDGFEDYLSGRGRELMMLRVHRAQVLDVCPRCAGDSHAAYLGPGFAGAFYDSHVQPLIDRARRQIRAGRPAISP